MKIFTQDNIKKHWLIALSLITLVSLGVFPIHIYKSNLILVAIIGALGIIIAKIIYAYLLYRFSYKNNGTKLLLFDILITSGQVLVIDQLFRNLYAMVAWVENYSIITNIITDYFIKTFSTPIQGYTKVNTIWFAIEIIIIIYYVICSFYLYEFNRNKELERKFVTK